MASSNNPPSAGQVQQHAAALKPDRRGAVAAALLILLAEALAGTRLDAADGQAPQTTTPAEALKIVVVDLSGTVQVRQHSDAPWQRPVKGQVLPVGADFRTGWRSWLRLAVGEHQIMTLDRMGTASILKAVRRGGRINTDVGLKRGRLLSSVEAEGLELASRVHGPSGTAAIRGTDQIFDEDPWAPRVIVFDGRARFRAAAMDRFVSLGHRGKRAEMAAGDDHPAQAASRRNAMNPQTRFAGRTRQELELLERLQLFGGDQVRQVGVFALHDRARAGALIGEPPLATRQLLITTNVTGASADAVTLSVQGPQGEVLSAQSPVYRRGGIELADHQTVTGGGKVFYGLVVPPGTYQATVNLTGGTSAVATTTALLDPLTANPALFGPFFGALTFPGNATAVHSFQVTGPQSPATVVRTGEPAIQQQD